MKYYVYINNRKYDVTKMSKNKMYDIISGVIKINMTHTTLETLDYMTKKVTRRRK